MKIIREETTPNNPELRFFYTNSRQEIIDIENDTILKKTFADVTFSKFKLFRTIIPKNADRIITYGNNSEGIFICNLGLRIFDKSGKQIDSNEKINDRIAEKIGIAHFEFDKEQQKFLPRFDSYDRICLQSDIVADDFGSIYFIYRKINNQFLVKLDPNGQIAWGKPIGSFNFFSNFQIKTSANGNFILLFQGDLAQTTVFDCNGNVISKFNLVMRDVDFICDTQLVALDNTSWTIYDFVDNFKVIKSGINSTLTNICQFKIDSAKRYFVTLSYFGNDYSTYILRVYRFKNFKLVGERHLNYPNYVARYNPIWKIEKNKVNLRFTDKLIELKIR